MSDRGIVLGASLKKLNITFMFHSGSTRRERTKISSLARFGVLFARVQSKLPVLKFSDHDIPEFFPYTRMAWSDEPLCINVRFLTKHRCREIVQREYDWLK